MFRTRSIGSNKRQIDISRSHGAKLDLSLFSRLDKTLRTHFIFGKVNAIIALEFGNHPIKNFPVEVVAAQMSIAVSRQHVKKMFAKFQNRHVESSAA